MTSKETLARYITLFEIGGFVEINIIQIVVILKVKVGIFIIEIIFQEIEIISHLGKEYLFIVIKKTYGIPGLERDKRGVLKNGLRKEIIPDKARGLLRIIGCSEKCVPRIR